MMIIEEATQYVSLDRLCLSPQCGVVSTEEGNTITNQDQWNKLKLVVDIAGEVWQSMKLLLLMHKSSIGAVFL